MSNNSTLVDGFSVSRLSQINLLSCFLCFSGCVYASRALSFSVFALSRFSHFLSLYLFIVSPQLPSYLCLCTGKKESEHTEEKEAKERKGKKGANMSEEVGHCLWFSRSVTSSNSLSRGIALHEHACAQEIETFVGEYNELCATLSNIVHLSKTFSQPQVRRERSQLQGTAPFNFSLGMYCIFGVCSSSCSVLLSRLHARSFNLSLPLLRFRVTLCLFSSSLTCP